MKAMLLAAGRGERLRPLTDHTAKPLIMAGDKSLIGYHLESLSAAGITEVVINTCWQADKVVAQIGKGSQYGIDVQYSHEPQALETAGGIANALPLLGTQPFIVISADIWCDFDLATISKPDNALGHLVLVDNPPHNAQGDFSLEGGRVIEKSYSTLTYSGIGVFEPSLFKNLPEKRLPLRHVLLDAIEKQRLTGIQQKGTWFDIGTIERLQQLKRHLA